MENQYEFTCLEEPDAEQFRAFLFLDGTPTLFNVEVASKPEALFAEINQVGILHCTATDPDAFHPLTHLTISTDKATARVPNRRSKPRQPSSRSWTFLTSATASRESRT
ncbi:MAG: hypothetical protein RI568_15550 [Natronomonas sp.]|uniref:hypothetical protein n=1 Tax=Natronomonas sp. TaxID=2184060 RepID=UPI00287018D5|nr:hypothetical protein [Natronomonas sp.]MDR9432096.1 hypothetical protein [Natronomonas sp.]